MRNRLLPLLMVLAAPLGVAAQQPAHDACRIELGGDLFGPGEDLERLLDLRGDDSGRTLMLRRASDSRSVNACPVGALRSLARAFAVDTLTARAAAALPLTTGVEFRSAYPRDWNNGELRGGAGLSAGLSFGGRARWGMLEAALVPSLVVEENGSYDIDPYPGELYSPFIHRWQGRYIDLPQRFGNNGARRLSTGQSYIRLNTGSLRTGVSTENLTWGPALRNPLLLSATAPGFAHLFVESAQPLDVFVGTAEFQLLWGRLAESEYFDLDPTNDHRAITGVHGILTPRGLYGLHLGVAHLHLQPWRDATSLGDVLLGAFRGIDADSLGFQRDLRLFALSLRWTAAPGGFEIYGEWARQDSWKEWIRLLNTLDAAQAYTIGAQRIWDRGSVAVRVNAEFSHLSDDAAHRDLGLGLGTFYVSPYLPQGHTHRGQLLGAPIGPGSESQYIGTDVFWKYGRSSLSVERVRYNDDAFYAVWAQFQFPHGHDTELSLRAGHLHKLNDFVLDAEVGYSMRYSRSLLGLSTFNYPGYPYRRDDNVTLRLGVRWVPTGLTMSW